MSRLLAEHHLSLALSPHGVLRRRRPALDPARQHHPHRQRHHRLVLEERSRLPGLRTLPPGIRRHPHADRRARSRLAGPAVLGRHAAPTSSRSPATSNASTPSSASTASRPRPSSTPCPDGLDVRRLIDLARTRGPDAVRARALDDELIRGDLVSAGRDGHRASSSASTRTASTRSAAASSSRSTTSSIRGCRRASAPTTTAASRSARPTTGSRSTTSASSRRRSCCSRSSRST